jgi:hypothetical protein
MTKKNFVFAALLSAVCVTGTFAQVTVSGGVALSTITGVEVSGTTYDVGGTVGIGGNVFLDYLLPISVPLSLGAEIGVDVAKVEDSGYSSEASAIPILLRAAYHFDLMPKLDLYVVGKIGYVIGNVASESLGGLGFGADIGAAYYFNSKIGIFGEAGIDDYTLEKDIDGEKYKVLFLRFATIGVSGKF